MNDFSDLLSQAKKMQDKMKETQETLKKIEVEGISGGNAVKVTMNGDGELKKIFIEDSLLKDSKEMQEIESSLSSWDEMISLKNIRTYYLRYKGDDGYESLKRISINGSNTKTADITVPDADFPSYFFLRDCESETTKEPIQIEYDPSKIVS